MSNRNEDSLHALNSNHNVNPTYIIDFIACLVFCDLGEKLTRAKL